MKTNTPFLSIIVPVYNEEKRVTRGIAKILHFIDQQTYASELIVVNDGSTDQTVPLVKKFKHPGVRLISYEKNQGKGYAIREGMRKARGDVRLFLDVDLSTPIEEFRKFLPYHPTHDVIIGSRRAQGARILVHQTFLREWLGSVFTRLSSVFLGVKASDFTCGFKCFSRKAARKIFSLQRLHGWGFDSEIMYLAQKKGFIMREVPVTWSNDSRTRVILTKDVFLSLLDLIKIRMNDIVGTYGPNHPLRV